MIVRSVSSQIKKESNAQYFMCERKGNITSNRATAYILVYPRKGYSATVESSVVKVTTSISN